MNARNADEEMGIRITSPNLVYSANDSSLWIGSGILNKPIGDFNTGGFWNGSLNGIANPYFGNLGGSIQVRVSSSVIPEPEEYALVFGLFALGFVIFRRHFKRNRQL